MREGAKGLGEDNTKVLDATETGTELGEDAVEDVAEKMHAQAAYDCLASLVAMSLSATLVHDYCIRRGLQMIRDVAEDPRNRNLDEETDGGESVGLQAVEAEALDDGGTIGIEATLGTVVDEGDEEMDPKAPVAKLQSILC
jgi:hypothetical protein